MIDNKTSTNDINKFITGKMVASLNAVRETLLCSTTRMSILLLTYNDIPEAAKMLEDEKEQVERKGYKAKLQYELKLEKVKIASKWEYISRQITGTISKMLLLLLTYQKKFTKR